MQSAFSAERRFVENVENVDKLKTDAENRVKSGIIKDYNKKLSTTILHN